ncbi:MAG TPA: 16S rRNA (guanine(966)-N(2))-methyltransferase RsmD [Candidatus Obscuribacter sp.]|nr:16S rRNA (guanine(966)-N(2))-methyltransferase RsmD [Candidatus Obscuribacter sp.]
MGISEEFGLRITGGELRGRSVTCPRGLAVRPTSSKVRQAFFNILGDRLRHARFLDLFSGSGLMGFEALSRGATVTFVERHSPSRAAIKATAEQFKLSEERYRVRGGDVLKVLPDLSGEEFDIVFADPPYKLCLGPAVAELLVRHRLLGAGALYVVEHMSDDPVTLTDGSLERVDFRQYGGTAISMFQQVCTK